MMTLEEFKRNVSKIDSSRIHKIRGSLGVYDAFKYYRQHRPDDKKFVLKDTQYFSIIRMMNNLLVKQIIKGEPVKLPCGMGYIEVRKYNRTIKVGKDGKIITNLPIDWNSTLKLWYEDEESYKNRTLLRINEKEIFKIYWNKENCKFNNRSFYELKFNKEMRKELKYNIKTGVLKDTCVFRIYHHVE